MNETEARLWYEGKLQALSDQAMDALWANHKQFTAACLRAVVARFPPLAPRWTTNDYDYADRLFGCMAALSALADTYLDGVRGIVLDYAYKSYLFGYYGNAWQVGGGSTKQPMQEDAIPGILGAWEGNDLAGRLAEAKVDFMQRARREIILSQSAVDDKGATVGEDLAAAQERVRGVCGYPENVLTGRVIR